MQNAALFAAANALTLDGAVTAYALAVDSELVLVPQLGGPTRLEGDLLHWDATASLSEQSAAICSVLALLCYPDDAWMRERLGASLTRLCVRSMGPLAAWPNAAGMF